MYMVVSAAWERMIASETTSTGGESSTMKSYRDRICSRNDRMCWEPRRSCGFAVPPLAGMKCMPEPLSTWITDSIDAEPSRRSTNPSSGGPPISLETPGRLRSQSIRSDRVPDRATLRASDVEKTVLPSDGSEEVIRTIFGGSSTSEYRSAVRADRMASEYWATGWETITSCGVRPLPRAGIIPSVDRPSVFSSWSDVLNPLSRSSRTNAMRRSEEHTPELQSHS